MTKIEPLPQPVWVNDEARELFEALERKRNEMVDLFRIDLEFLRPEKLDHELTATEALIRHQRRSAKRIAEAEFELRQALKPIEKEMVELVSRFTRPAAIVRDAE